MRIDCLTLFPAMLGGPLTESILKRALDDSLMDIHLHDLRQWGQGTHRQVDDTPYGGGAGMLLRADVLVQALEDVGLMRMLPGMNVINPSDALEAQKAVVAAAMAKGPSYIRFGRTAVP